MVGLSGLASWRGCGELPQGVGCGMGDRGGSRSPRRGRGEPMSRSRSRSRDSGSPKSGKRCDGTRRRRRPLSRRMRSSSPSGALRWAHSNPFLPSDRQDGDDRRARSGSSEPRASRSPSRGRTRSRTRSASRSRSPRDVSRSRSPGARPARSRSTTRSPPRRRDSRSPPRADSRSPSRCVPAMAQM